MDVVDNVLVDGTPMAAGHLAMKFGGVGAVHGWDRAGAMLCHIARVVLRIPALRYVDDFFAVDHPECVDHAMTCFARMVRAVLGPNAVAPDKLAHGVPLEVLGLVVRIINKGIELVLPDKKMKEWTGQLLHARQAGVMPPWECFETGWVIRLRRMQQFPACGPRHAAPLFSRSNTRPRKASG